MGSHKSLRLPDRLESPPTPFPNPCRLIGLLSPVIPILLSAVDCFWDQLTMSDTIATQLVRHDFPWLAAIIPQQASKETLRLGDCFETIEPELELTQEPDDDTVD